MRQLRWAIMVVGGACLGITAPPVALASPLDEPAVQAPQASRDTVSFKTRQGFAACTSRDRLHQMITHVAKGESEKYREMIENPNSGCFLLKPGLNVTPLGYNAAYVELRPVGTKVTIWTVLEAIEKKPASYRGNS